MTDPIPYKPQDKGAWPPSLVGELRPQLRELGVEDDQIRIENWA